jgi:hypothetical protein
VTLTLTPALGRDYKSRAQVAKDWHADRGFLVVDEPPWGGMLITRSECQALGVSQVTIRYASGRRVLHTVVPHPQVQPIAQALREHGHAAYKGVGIEPGVEGDGSYRLSGPGRHERFDNLNDALRIIDRLPSAATLAHEAN